MGQSTIDACQVGQDVCGFAYICMYVWTVVVISFASRGAAASWFLSSESMITTYGSTKRFNGRCSRQQYANLCETSLSVGVLYWCVGAAFIQCKGPNYCFGHVRRVPQRAACRLPEKPQIETRPLTTSKGANVRAFQPLVAAGPSENEPISR